MEDLPAQLPILDGRYRRSAHRPSGVDASRRHPDDHERLRQGYGGRFEESQRRGCSIGFAGKPHNSAVCEVGLGYRGLEWSWEMRLVARNLLRNLVAGEGFEPSTFGL